MRNKLTWYLLAGASAALVGCAEQPGDPSVVDGDDATDFVSYRPAGESGGFREGGLAAGEPPADSDSAERAIAEADVIQVDGDTLYALSTYTGMTVVDLSDPSALRVTGRYRTAATPFEMYLRGGVAYVMFNGFWRWVPDAGGDGGQYQSTARMVALDVSDPANIRTLGDHDVPGDIADSRMVGDVIYLVTHQSSYCWGCDDLPTTRITSFDASTPGSFGRIDELSFEEREGSWGSRSIAVTTERMYVGGPQWSDTTSGIQVVDISDPAGSLGLGAEIAIAGPIQNRWQMDEHEGVLRVISQAGGWRSTTPPVIETFQVTSADEITPLGSTTMTLPRPEDLRSVRFDGTRAYAVTFEQVDPLFTIDLSDPANPRQMGELEIPGWVYHMEPRGDRVYGIGYDDWAEGRGLTVSVFDVSDLSAPTMLDRVAFGGQWAWQVEDQDRIHKAFRVMLDRGLILVPYAGSDVDEATCSWRGASGIQIIEVAGDDLRLRGVAPQVGVARRALLLGDTLYGVSDNAIQSFDVHDLDAPAALDRLDVARNVSTVHVMGDSLMRFGNDWWTGETFLDVTSLAGAEDIESTTAVDMSAMTSGDSSCTSRESIGYTVYAHGDFAYVPRYRYNSGSSSWQTELSLFVVDLRDRANPTILGEIEIEPTNSGSDSTGYQSEYYADVVLTDSALLVGRQRYAHRTTDGTSDNRYFYDVFDLRDPATPAFTQRLEVPVAYASGGWGHGYYGCTMDLGYGWWHGGGGESASLVSGDIVASNHAEPVEGAEDPSLVRYYLDRIDVSDPANPRVLPPINIPGQVVLYDGQRDTVVTLEDRPRTIEGSDYESCARRGWRTSWDGEHTCRVWDRRLNALALEGDHARRISLVTLDDDEMHSGSIAVTTNRVFVSRTNGSGWGYDPSTAQQQIRTFGITEDGRLRRMGDAPYEGPAYYWSQLVARGDRAFLAQYNTLTVVDASLSTETPTVIEHEMPGWSCSSLEVAGDTAFCAMGQQGVLRFDLGRD